MHLISLVWQLQWSPNVRLDMFDPYERIDVGQRHLVVSKAHKNEQLEEERVTPIEARSPVKIIEPY